MVTYKLIKVTINNSGLDKVNINIVIGYNKLLKSIINDCGPVFTLRFWFLLYYFFRIK